MAGIRPLPRTTRWTGWTSRPEVGHRVISFEPQTNLERLLVQAHTHPTSAKAYEAFVRELMGAVIGALGRREPHGFQPLVLAPAGVTGVCVFSHPLRYHRFSNEVMLPAPDWEVRPEQTRQLCGWAVANELSVLLNPGSECGKDFPAFELERMLRGQWV